MLASRETIFIGSLVTANKFALHASHHSMSCTSLSDWRISARTSLRSGTGSDVVLEMVAVLVYVVPSAVPGGTCAVRVKTALPPAGKLASVQVTVPPAPTAGVEQFHPPGDDRLTKVRFPCSGSVTVTDAAASGPPFAAVSV